jgi:amino acid transporter
MQFAFAICLLFTMGNVDKVTHTPTGLPIIEVYYEATGSKTVTNIFVSAILVVIFVALFNCFASVSRLTWAFARDGGIPFHQFFSTVSANQTLTRVQ